jgi:formylglycine-generating enzyme required for sulfatase activity
VAALEPLLAEHPDDRDAQALLDRARAEIAAAEQRRIAKQRAREVAEAQARQAAAERTARKRYGVAWTQLAARNIPQAIDALERLLQERWDDQEALTLLTGLIENADVPLEQRLRAARLAGQYGDPRPGVCSLPRSLDDPYWADPIPAGEYPIANGQARLQLSEFRIGRYPVTVWQFRRFWSDPQGYENQELWPVQGWTWKQAGTPTKQPYLWDNSDWTAANQPVIGVSWYEAMAFCRWLDARGRTEGWLPKEREIGLPSEAEWEVAAMWDAASRKMRAWAPPDGALWQNVTEAGIGRTSPVGLFPQSVSACGALDMAGNVWEWCASAHGGYPQQAAVRGDDYPAGQTGPALRGGAYYTENKHSGWDARGAVSPGYLWGFRIVVRSRFERSK